MTLRASLIAMTVVAVVSDSMLHPFYPQYFASVFGVHDARLVGIYIAACSLTVLTSLPLWAAVERRVSILKLLVVTQLVACALSLACSATRSLALFGVLSLAMMVCKASYLLIYPYVMRLEDGRNHTGTIGLLAFVVYSGNTLAALLSGLTLQLLDASRLFSAMAIGDALQVAICVHLLRRAELATEPSSAIESEPEPPLPRGFVHRLGAVMCIVYFSAYLSEPFFLSYWEGLSTPDSKIVSGAVFAIPGIAALLALFWNQRSVGTANPYAQIAPAIVLAIAGLWLQTCAAWSLLLLGRFAYGWALFQCMVRLDALLFRFSAKHSYALDFSKINTFQGLGVLLAASAAGALVSQLGVMAPFHVAAGGFALALTAYLLLFRKELRPNQDTFAQTCADTERIAT